MTSGSDTFDYLVSLQLVNIAVANPVNLSPTVALRSLSYANIRAKYGEPKDLRPSVQAHINTHVVEAVFEMTGTLEDYNRDRSLGCHALERSITDAFLIALPSGYPMPYAIQALVEPREPSGVRAASIDMRGVGDFEFHARPLSDPHARDVESTYRALTHLPSDRVLAAAIDRLITGKRKDLHRVMNEPNWDKVIDYVIALESLFLTVNGRGGPGNSDSRLSGGFASQSRLEGRNQEQKHDQENETEPHRRVQGKSGAGGVARG